MYIPSEKETPRTEETGNTGAIN